MTDSKRIDKIVKLLAQAEGTNSPEEAKTYSAKAQALMTEWEIDDARIQQARINAGQKPEVVGDDKVWFFGRMTTMPTATLWNVVAANNGVRLVIVKDSRPNPDPRYTNQGIWLHMFGYQGSIDRTRMMAGSLMIQAEREFLTPEVQEKKRWECSAPTHHIKWKNAFMNGYASGVASKLSDARRAAEAAAPVGTELALRDRSLAVNKAVTARYRNLSNTNSSAGSGARGANAAGYAAGRRAQTDQQSSIGGTSNRSIG